MTRAINFCVAIAAFVFGILLGGWLQGTVIQ